ncbi:aminotransferase class V-fold PLP-dependent enzyme [Algoriphagus sp.]|jgi:glutamate/tyrosine decarboxylase-like PLP-dependent enzyme|uniref:pyridoxal phosphate-dependent decarboxylase family protein n=1 Tax=Algoriphagus sp. TaxID=1872435 RepID=UPI0027241E6A|nr:aminotransferase class V-fold PLP-dependent enzyme [Algoriphagus sp.]MDO8968947.1 aminotransferase class V-fold PLP-dependent enzyme [Algoriphagus sp.]MDP3202101.1 aminotransferase class V-fold PLP-dependent enzyme [Algoriphagus sp.]
MKTDTTKENLTLDPENWDAMRQLGHRMIDDLFDYWENIRNEKIWKPIPQEVKEFLDQPIPEKGQNPEEVYQEFKQNIFPYNKGNVHPRFFAWIQGTGTPLGVLADLLASGMNPNVAIGEHSAMYVDRQVVNWCKELMNFPADASGILVSGGSMANITALTVARNSFRDEKIRQRGLKAASAQLVLYCSTETHSCIQKAAEIIGLGTDSVRKIGVNGHYEMKADELEFQIQRDIEAGLLPFCIVGTSGTVNTGAIDPMDELLAVSKKYGLWFHVDGAYGALAKLDPKYADRLKAIEEADSLAFDLHKWLYVPYEVGCTLIRDAKKHRDSFALTPNYLIQESRGLSGGLDSINNHGFELSRGFKALKIWMSLKEHGREKYAQMIAQNNRQAEYLADLVNKSPDLELMAPVSMSITCFRMIKLGYTENQLRELNREILLRLQEEGIASPSSTILNGKYTLRIANVNQRTQMGDMDLLIREVLRIGSEIQ